MLTSTPSESKESRGRFKRHASYSLSPSARMFGSDFLFLLWEEQKTAARSEAGFIFLFPTPEPPSNPSLPKAPFLLLPETLTLAILQARMTGFLRMNQSPSEAKSLLQLSCTYARLHSCFSSESEFPHPS